MKKLFRKYAFLIPFLVIALLLVGNFLGDTLLKIDGKCGKGILINKRIYTRTTIHLTYAFYLDGRTYTGNSQEGDISKVGDSVCIVYLSYFPGINRALKYFDEGEIKCNCLK